MGAKSQRGLKHHCAGYDKVSAGHQNKRAAKLGERSNRYSYPGRGLRWTGQAETGRRAFTAPYTGQTENMQARTFALVDSPPQIPVFEASLQRGSDGSMSSSVTQEDIYLQEQRHTWDMELPPGSRERTTHRRCGRTRDARCSVDDRSGSRTGTLKARRKPNTSSGSGRPPKHGK